MRNKLDIIDSLKYAEKMMHNPNLPRDVRRDYTIQYHCFKWVLQGEDIE